MGDLTEHFSRSELECRCGCGLFNAKGRLLSTLEVIRRAVGKSVHIESGCRCAEKNADVGGKPNSGHLTGEAADIWVEGLSNRDLGGEAENKYMTREIRRKGIFYNCVKIIEGWIPIKGN